MEVKYVVPGETGKQCQDCKNFEADENENSGKCMGYPVQADAGCNLFETKKTDS